MKHYMNIAFFVLLVAAVIYLTVDFMAFKHDTRAAMAVLTVGSLISLVLYAATHSAELRKTN
jgi:hypothetical protein